MGLLSQGFSESELDTVEMRAYFKNGIFNNLQSTTLKYDAMFGLGRIAREYDWVIYFPESQKSYSISAITDEDKETIEADCKTTRGCYNAVASFKLNGQVVNAPNATLTK